jgi:flagellum-specific ATP synthase
MLQTLIRDIAAIPRETWFGRVSGVSGLLIEVSGAENRLSVGQRLSILPRSGPPVMAEVTGFKADRALCLPFGSLEGIGTGCRADILSDRAEIRPSPSWRGRVINGFGEPIDGKGPLGARGTPVPLRAKPPQAHLRARVGDKLDTGVRAMDIFTPLCRGQRMGIFAGSGVGKSVLLSMLARNTDCDIAVIGLIGERGREVQDFLENELGAEGLSRAIVIVATSDEPALLRRQAAWLTLSVAEYFRDAGQHVLCLMDSVTRFAMAQREIGLACGEPPATKGYTPTVFAELPKLLERAGPGVVGSGAITGLFTVLVDGDDHNEPIADAVRGILDGHLVMERSIAERGRYPAINVLKSISRTLPEAHSEAENKALIEARAHLAIYADMEEMIRLGAYRAGSNADVDHAMKLAIPLEALLKQDKRDVSTRYSAFNDLGRILGHG